MTNILLVILVTLALAYFLSEIFKSLGLPRVLGQVLAGIFLGIPIIKNYLFDANAVSVVSFLTNIGIILLFFFVGLETNLLQFRKNVKESAMISIFNTLVPFSLGFIASRALFHFDNLASLVIGISLSVSSQAISLDILDEAKMLKSKIANLMITAGTVDDIFELIAISLVLVIFHTAGFTGEGTVFSLLIDIGIFVIIVMILRVTLIPFALRAFERDNSQAILFMGALIIVLLMAYLSEIFGVSSLIGALVAGIIVRQTLISGNHRQPWRKNEISHLIHVISFGFLIPIFFVNVGLQTDIQSIFSNVWLALVLIFIDLFGTVGGTLLGVVLSKGTVKEGMIVGWGMAPKGDTELVIATLALSKSLITTDIYTAIVAVAIASTFIAPIVFKFLIRKHKAA
ncbi:MAG: cation:proton antiporter [Nanoarchaeota archaeon]